MVAVTGVPGRSRAGGFGLLLGWAVLLVVLWLRALPTAQAMSEADFLPPEQAFPMSAQVVADTLQLQFCIAPGYYLYHEPFRFVPEPGDVALGQPQIPPGTVIFDPIFEKDLETHRDGIVITVPLPAEPRPFTLQVTSQGCADAGLCYPPQTWPVALQVGPGGGWSAQALPVDSGWGGGASVAGSSGFSLGALGNWREANDLGLAEGLAGAALWQTVAVFFLLGVLLSLTPCVLPMLPILSSLLVGDQVDRQARGIALGRWRGLGLASSYVLGMSLVYTAAGVAAGLTGASLAATLQTPWVLSVFAVVLVVLALAMFNVFTVQVPGAWQLALTRLVNRLPGGRVTGAFGMGAVSALIVGPCVAAPLAGALLYISQTGDVWLGGLALFAMAWGMGVSLLVAGASASTLLPKAGAWMEGVKQFFGVLLLAVAWWMVLPVIPAVVAMAGWAVLAFFAASLLGAFNALAADAGVARRAGKGLAWLLVLVGSVQVVGLASGGRDALQPLAHWAGGGAGGVWGVGAPVAVPAGGESVAAPPAANGAWVPGVSGSPGSSGLSGAARPDSGWLTGAGAAVPGGVAGGGAGLASAHPPFQRVNSVAELEAVVAGARGRPVMLDFYADWCVSCKEMERFTFSQPAVAQRMAQMVLVQADVTANTAEHQALLRRFRLFGPPGIIFFDTQGREQTHTRVIGFQNAERFGATLDRVLGS